MSDIPTPRTDAAESNWWSEDGLRSAFIVRADFARELEREMNQLRKERDEARRMYCKEVEHHHDTTWNDGERDFKPLPALDVAISKGWDCFKEDGK